MKTLPPSAAILACLLALSAALAPNHALAQEAAPKAQPMPADNDRIDPLAKAKKVPVTRLSKLALGMTWVGTAVSDPDCDIWCTSPIMGEDGKVHLFCSRWWKGSGFGAWNSQCNIAHFIGDKPEGPFKYVDTAIAAHPGARWNNTKHNPFIGKAGNKYVLLYITQDMNHPDDWLTCMATADSLSGPWTLQGTDPERPGLIIVPSKDPKHWSYGVHAIANPCFLTYGGKYYIYANFSFLTGRHPPDTYGYAVADKLEGPYKIGDAPCIENSGYIEDSTAYISDGKFHLLMHDNSGMDVGDGARGLLWTSDTPTMFRSADAEIGYLAIPDYGVDVSKAHPVYGGGLNFERPGILMIKGQPAYFYAPCGNNIMGIPDRTCSYVMKIDLKHVNPVLASYCIPSVSLLKPAKASSVWGIGYSADKAFDGSVDTRWSADANDKRPWLEVDLGMPTEVSRAVIQEPLPFVAKFSLEAKQADGSWKSLVQGETIGWRRELKFQPEKAQYFRLNILESKDGAPTITEMKLFAK